MSSLSNSLVILLYQKLCFLSDWHRGCYSLVMSWEKTRQNAMAWIDLGDDIETNVAP